MFLFFIALLLTQSLSAHQWNPDFYANELNGQTPQMRFAIKEVPKLQLKGHESVLDVGCGDGKISAFIAHNYVPYGTMHGIDISPTMIQEAQSKHSAPNITFECISLFSYTPTQRYDAAVCFWVLYLLDDYTAALDKIISFLKPGGKALICHVIEPGPPFFQLFKKIIAPKKMPITLPSLETVACAIKSVPAQLNYLEVKYNYAHYANLTELINSMMKIPFFKLLPPEKELEFYKQLSMVYKEEADGSVYLSSPVLCMIIEKKAPNTQEGIA